MRNISILIIYFNVAFIGAAKTIRMHLSMLFKMSIYFIASTIKLKWGNWRMMT